MTDDGRQDDDAPPPPGPLRDLAEALNPSGGALGVVVPFALSGEVDDPHEMQLGLFSKERKP